MLFILKHSSFICALTSSYSGTSMPHRNENFHCKPASSVDFSQKMNIHFLLLDHPKPVGDFHLSGLKWHRAPSQEHFVQFPQPLSNLRGWGSLNLLLSVANLSLSVHIFCPVSVRLSFVCSKINWLLKIKWLGSPDLLCSVVQKTFVTQRPNFIWWMTPVQWVKEVYGRAMKSGKNQFAKCILSHVCAYTLLRVHGKICFARSTHHFFITTNRNLFSWKQYSYGMPVKSLYYLQTSKWWLLFKCIHFIYPFCCGDKYWFWIGKAHLLASQYLCIWAL